MNIKLSGDKDKHVQGLIFNILDILAQAGVSMPDTVRRLERMAMACLAAGRITGSFGEAKSSDDGIFSTTRELIAFVNTNYGENISSGSYDDVRRKDLLPLLQAGVVVNSSSMEMQATNNPTRGYALNPQFARLLSSYGTLMWKPALEDYRAAMAALMEKLARKRASERIPVRFPSGVRIELSAGEHNVLQKAVVEEFLPRFGMGAELLYLGDTSDKFLFVDRERLSSIGFFDMKHEELPDVVAYSRERNLLLLVEAVHSAGPMSEARVAKLRDKLACCTAAPVYVTAFQDRKEFRKWVADIAWETEVWIADSPDHMIHFNGYKFLEIHK